MFRLFLKAFKGARIWKKLEKKYKAGCYILMPRAEEEYNYYALLYLNKFVEKFYKDSEVIILTFDEGVKKALPLFTEKTAVSVIDFPRKKAEALIQYYALYEFSTKLKIVSLTEPYDTCAENLLGVKGVTKEDLLCYDIYRLDHSYRDACPKYTGDDQDIQRLLKYGRIAEEA